MNLPNFITLLRILMTVLFIAIFPINTAAAALMFVLASLSDFFDGYLARKYDLVTSFGKIMDPIADKFLILSAFAMFAQIRIIWWWMFWAIAVREISVTLFRFWAMSKGKVLEAEKFGKIKTVVQMAAIILLFASLIFYPYIFYGKVCPMSLPFYLLFLIAFDIIMVLAAVCITVFSGLAVFWNNRQLLFKEQR